MDALPPELLERILCAVPRTSRAHLQWPTVCKKWWDACKQVSVAWNFMDFPFKAQGKCRTPHKWSVFTTFKVELIRFAPWISPPLLPGTAMALRAYVKTTWHDILSIALTLSEHVVTLDCRNVWSLRGEEWEHFLLSLHENHEKFPKLVEVWNADVRLTRVDDGSWSWGLLKG